MLKMAIGNAAGEIWTFLGKNGKTSLAKILGESKSKPEIATMAIGWLAREDKVHITSDAKATHVYLTEAEAKKYKASNA